MKTDTRQQILKIIEEHDQIRPHDLLKELEIKKAALYLQLKKLLQQNKITKQGRPPLVFYSLVDESDSKETSIDISSAKLDVIRQEYLYVTAEGELKYGLDGFIDWFSQTSQNQSITVLAEEYIKARRQFSANKHGWVNASSKFQQTFTDFSLEKVCYADFYSLPKFGKTKLGLQTLHGKQAQHRGLIEKVAAKIKPIIHKIILKHEIKAAAYVPHSIPRKIPFLKVVKSELRLSLPEVELVKAYKGTLPVAQKSLSKLEERIKNAKETILVKKPEISFEKVLLIDDVVGSGATLNETAKKLKKRGVAEVFGFAVVGSVKGFEVIQEV